MTTTIPSFCAVNSVPVSTSRLQRPASSGCGNARPAVAISLSKLVLDCPLANISISLSVPLRWALSGMAGALMQRAQ